MPDTLSRLNKPCECSDCSVTRFVDEIPTNAELMTITGVANSAASVTNIIWNNVNKGVEAVLSQQILNSLTSDIGAIPFGNKKVGKSMQLADNDCKTAIDLITTGNTPSKKTKNRG